MFLCEDHYVDFRAENIMELSVQLFNGKQDELEKAEIAFSFVRDEIPHSFDMEAGIITARASDVLKYQTGICHAKANLLCALMRAAGIPAGFCYEHITLADDDSLGYCLHCYNAVYVDNRWIMLDARGNKPGVNAQFSPDKPVLAYPPRRGYDEYLIEGIYAKPHQETMEMLEQADNLQDIIDNIPEFLTAVPDILCEGQ